MKKKKYSQRKHSNIADAETPKKKKTGIIIVSLIVFIMLFSVFAVSLYSGDPAAPNNQKLDYNNREFIQDQQGFWTVDIEGTKYSFNYAPADAEMIKSEDLGNFAVNGKLYLIFDPKDFYEGSNELLIVRQFLSQRYNNLATIACSTETGCSDIPIVNCETIDSGVYLKLGNNSEIYKKDNCVVLEINPGDEYKVIDRFMYELLGVI